MLLFFLLPQARNKAVNYLHFVERCNDHTSKLILNFNPYYKLIDKMKIRNIRHKGESSSSLATDCLAS